MATVSNRSTRCTAHATGFARCPALRNFAFVKDEPSHVQAFELPNSRRAYERLGSPWKIVLPKTWAALLQLVDENDRASDQAAGRGVCW